MPDNKPYSLKGRIVSSHSLPCRDDTKPHHFRTRVRLCRAEALILLLQQELRVLVLGTGQKHSISVPQPEEAPASAH